VPHRPDVLGRAGRVAVEGGPSEARLRVSALRRVDWALAGGVLALGLWGLGVGYSATRAAGALAGGLVVRQAVFLAVGVGATALLACLDYRLVAQAGKALYLPVVALLVAVLAFGRSGGGAARWLGAGPVRFQPSEFAKVALLVVLAAFLARHPSGPRWGPSGSQRGVERARSLRTFVGVLLITAIPALLVFLQPDLGTAIVLLAVCFGMAALAGARKLHLALALALGVLAFAAMWHTGAIKPYQKRRLVTFLNPGADPLGSGYHILQSKIAIGSGMVFGRGFLAGPQSGLRFVPAQHTDFIFAVVGEELGLVGCAVLLGLYALVLWRMIRIARRAEEPLGALLAGAGAWLVLFQVVMNIGMTVTLLPVTGIPLPFVSYGGSSLVSNMMLVGLVLSVGARTRSAG